MPEIERRAGLDRATFVADHLAPGRPVIVTDAMATWPARTTWTADRLAARFGDRTVPLYDELFTLTGLSTLAEYVATWFGRDLPPDARRPYVRWYSTQSAHRRYPWADAVLDELAAEWSNPAFLPDDGFVVPYCPPGQTRDPSRHRFPARGLYLSPAGARTRLHFDPWHTDAVLCQFQGRKRVRILPPDQAPRVSKPGRIFADLREPDLEAFPELPSATVLYDDVLEPGEVLYLPRTWLHEVDTLDDSLSLTWNFAHAVDARGFLRFLTGDPTPQEVRDLEFFWFER